MQASVAERNGKWKRGSGEIKKASVWCRCRSVDRKPETFTDIYISKPNGYTYLILRVASIIILPSCFCIYRISVSLEALATTIRFGVA